MRAASLFALTGLLLAGCASPGDPPGDGDSGGSDHGSHAGTSGMTGMSGMHGHGTGMSAGMAHVTIRDGSYDPSQVNATTEGGIHFTNEGDERHTVTILDDQGFIVLDVELAAGEATHFQPPSAGSYHAFCRFHEGAADLHVA